jgi:(p)ppGpp synthase/HD superfamily hydrolase
MDILIQIQGFAKDAHGDQQRKFEPEPYITHLVRVKKLCEEYTTERPILAAALLHDVLEDTAVTKQQIIDFLSFIMSEKETKLTVQFVTELTDVFTKKNYPLWNRRKRKLKEAARLGEASPQAQTIKYADIIDNSQSIINSTDNFASVYLYECRDLLKQINKGDKDLYKRAVDTVDICIHDLTDTINQR